MPAATKTRPVESVTRVTVAFPFSTIKMQNADLTDTVEELSLLVAMLAGELDERTHTTASEELAIRAQALVDELGAD